MTLNFYNFYYINKPKIMAQPLTTEMIVSRLFEFHSIAHFFHFQTDTHAKHVLLDELYKNLVKHKDAIGEYLMGRLHPEEKFIKFINYEVPEYSEKNLELLLDDGVKYAQRIQEHGREEGMEQLVSLAAELEGSFVKARLFYYKYK